MSVRSLVVLLLAVGCQGRLVSSDSKIKHVVVLMLENRAFDHMLGFLMANNSKIDGCLPSLPHCNNPLNPLNRSSPIFPVGNGAPYVASADPCHGNGCTLNASFGYRNWTLFDPPTSAPMSGFLANYEQKLPGRGQEIMQCFAPEHIPAMTTLAMDFAVIDSWHSAIPGPTQVNRLYANSATSYGYANNNKWREIQGFPQKTIFETLDQAEGGATWGGYFEDFPSLVILDYVRKLGSLLKLHSLDTFKKDAASGKLPSYSWVEPRYYDDFGKAARDQHPDHDVAEGDQLIKEVYEALRAGPAWNQTALLITYDEHGGFFDHQPLRSCPNPDGKNDLSAHFFFNVTGVRVPAILVSPWVDRQTVINAPETGPQYTHASIPATVRKLFAPEAPFLTKRDAWTLTFDSALSRSTPRTDCPMTIPAAASHRAFGGLPPIDKLGKNKLSHLQRDWVNLAAGLTNDTSITDDVLDRMSEGQGSKYVRAAINQVIGRQVV